MTPNNSPSPAQISDEEAVKARYPDARSVFYERIPGWCVFSGATSVTSITLSDSGKQSEAEAWADTRSRLEPVEAVSTPPICEGDVLCEHKHCWDASRKRVRDGINKNRREWLDLQKAQKLAKVSTPLPQANVTLCEFETRGAGDAEAYGGKYAPLPQCKHLRVLIEYDEMDPVAVVECKNCGLKWEEDVADKKTFEYLLACKRIALLEPPAPLPGQGELPPLEYEADDWRHIWPAFPVRERQLRQSRAELKQALTSLAEAQEEIETLKGINQNPAVCGVCKKEHITFWPCDYESKLSAAQAEIEKLKKEGR